jgi:phosphohistidine phosphatase
MQIYLLRHGIAEDAQPRQSDSERALTGEGREKLRRVLKRARAAEVVPDVIISSPYRRAVETAEEAAEVLGYKQKIVLAQALVPDAAPPGVWDEIRAHKHESSVLLAGHEPLLSSTVSYLLGSPALMLDMKKAALVRVDCESFNREPRGVLKWMLTPALAAGSV